jgi:hypothetical protein
MTTQLIDEQGYPLLNCGDVISVGKRKHIRVACPQPCNHEWVNETEENKARRLAAYGRLQA